MENEVQEQAAVSQDALEKALTQLNELAKSSKDEKQELLQKAMSTELSKEENSRLIELMSGVKAPQDTLAKSVTAQLQPENVPEVQEAVDVSKYLNAFNKGTLAALSTICDTMEKSDSQQHEFNIVLAKAVSQVGQLMKSLNDKVEKWAQQPAEQPKAARTTVQAQTQTIQKSFVGQEQEQISKGECLNLLEEMHMTSLQKGRGGLSSCGEDLQKSIAKYEMTGSMSRPLVNELMAYRSNKGRTA